ncbi:MAG TPA: hypothetical protein VGC41_05300 [Kofleriaceae bacterium]
MKWPLLLALVSCGGSARDPLKPGDDHDEGAGLLAHASQTLVGDGSATDDTEPPGVKRPARRYQNVGTPYGGDPYGGSIYGGDPYGGATYAHWTAPAFNYANAIRAPRYAVTDTGLDATIEGTITWAGTVPAPIKTSCGEVDSVQVGVNRGVRGVVVYIERVTTGRGIGGVGRASVGGMIAKHGCTLGPIAQIAVPMPSSISIFGDSARTKVKLTPPGGKPAIYELQEGGVVTTEVKPGVTRVEGEDGKLAASWVIGLESPYFSITDDAGRFRLEQLAPGTYDLTIWQAPIAAISNDGTFSYGSPIVMHRSVHVAAKQTTKLSVALGTP